LPELPEASVAFIDRLLAPTETLAPSTPDAGGERLSRREF